MKLQINRPYGGGTGYHVSEDGFSLEFYWTLWGAKRGFKKWKKKLLNPEKEIIYEEELCK